jgi:branched-chain amino acid transport system substrate-binding protein
MSRRGSMTVGFAFTAVCVFALLILVPSFAQAGDTIKIGAVEPRSGPMESVGRFMFSGLIQAVDEQNAKGGLFGKKIEIIWEDSEFKGDVATRKAKKLILEDKVDFLVSGASSPVMVALNKVSATNKILYFGYGAMTDDIQGREFSPYGFRLTATMYNVYSAMAQWMEKKPYRKFYILAPDYLSGYDTAKQFKEQMKIHVPDAKIVGEDFHPIANKDFGPYVTKMIASKADAIMLGSFGPDLTNVVKTIRSMGLKNIPILSHVIEPYPMNDMKEDAVGIHITNQYSLRVNTPENQDLLKKFHEKHKGDKDYLTWWPVGAMGGTIISWRVAFAAMEKAGTLDPDKFVKVFEGFQYKTPVGTYTMRACDHQMMTPMYGITIEGGPNPFYNGSIRPEIKFPFEGPKVEMFPAEKVALPVTKEYNPRCQ